MRNDPHRLANGFTLVEVLVSLVVASLLIGIVMNGAVQAKERKLRTTEKRGAVLLARELLTAATMRPPAPGVTRGAEGKLKWQLDEAVAAIDPARRYVLMNLAVVIRRNDDAHLLSAETRKLKLVAFR